jgi:hypothetical protein
MAVLMLGLSSPLAIMPTLAQADGWTVWLPQDTCFEGAGTVVIEATIVSTVVGGTPLGKYSSRKLALSP